MQKILHGSVMHHRLHPKEHRFTYSSPYIYCEVDKVAKENSFLPLFGYNKLSVFSVRQEDFLFNVPGENLGARIRKQLLDAGIKECFDKFQLITSPRFLGYVFNPVSFIICLRADGSVGALISQVNNTFGECHVYVASEPTLSKSGSYTKFSMNKVFHVSPFNDVKGIYEFLVRVREEHVEVKINLLEEIEGATKVKFRSFVRGATQPMSMKNWLLFWLKFPVGSALAVPLIMLEAAKLYFLRRLNVFSKPIAEDSMTVRKAQPSLMEKLYERLVLQYFSRIKDGQLRVEVDGSEHVFGDPEAEPAILKVRNRALFGEMVFGGDIALGEGFTKGYWSSPDMVKLIRVLAGSMKEYGNGEPGLARLFKPVRALTHLLRHNSRANAKKNISAHYDLSNEFFSAFLDPTMTYSCALYEKESDSLHQAQLNKIDALLDSLNLSPEHHLLEIGTGWGALAIRAVERFGCRVTSVTLSREQMSEALARIEKRGFSDKITVKYCDYRDIEGKFDRIVSVEMLEAVGHRYYPLFFKTLDRLLAKDGLVALQVITITDQRYESYKNGCDWIQKYIFPGGLCPSVSVLTEMMTKHSEFMVEEVHNIGVHYAKTLKEWREKFVDKWPEISKASGGKFDERFKRMWLYYLVYCEAGFAERLIGTHQFLLTREQNRSLSYAPGYEETGAEEEQKMKMVS